MLNTQAIDTVVMRELMIDHRPTGVTQVTGLVANDGPWTWFETTTFSGYYCDEEECPDDAYEDCELHPGDEYWRDQMRITWVANIRARGLRPVADPDLVKDELGLSR